MKIASFSPNVASVSDQEEKPPSDANHQQIEDGFTFMAEAAKPKKDIRLVKNNVQKIREEQLMSKAELARKAGLSALTIDRVEGGMSCRMDTMRKIILALGFKLSEKEKVFPEE